MPIVLFEYKDKFLLKRTALPRYRGFATSPLMCHHSIGIKARQLTILLTFACHLLPPTKMVLLHFVIRLAVLALVACVCRAFFLGSEKEGTFIPFEKLKDFGLSRNHKVYSHLVIPPWSRPFKLGYCESWEWHTDQKYRAQRLAICKELSEG